MFKTFLEILCWNWLQGTIYKTLENQSYGISYRTCAFVPTSFFILIFSAVFLHLLVPHLLNHGEFTVRSAGTVGRRVIRRRDTVKAKLKAEAKSNLAKSISWSRLLNLSLIAHNYFLSANATINNKYNNLKTINENYEKSNCHKLKMHIATYLKICL